MYHIKEDKRSKRSAECISQALLTCLEQKPFSKITITDIQKTSYVGRATFYRLFDNLTDVLAYQCDKIFSDALIQSKLNNQRQNIRLQIITFISHCMENYKTLECIVDCDRMDILYRAHKTYMKQYFDSYSEEKLSLESLQDYCIATLTSIMTSTLYIWVQHGKKENAEELYEKMILCNHALNKMIFLESDEIILDKSEDKTITSF